MARNKRCHHARSRAPDRKRAIAKFLGKTKRLAPKFFSKAYGKTKGTSGKRLNAGTVTAPSPKPVSIPIERPWPRVIPICAGSFLISGGGIDEILERDLLSVGSCT